MLVFAQMPQRVVVLASAVLFSCWLASMTFMLIVLVKCDSLKTCTRLYGIYKISKSHKRCFCRLCVSRIWTVTLRQNRWQHLLQYMQRFKETIFQMYIILYLFLYDLVDHRRQLSLSIYPSSESLYVRAVVTFRFMVPLAVENLGFCRRLLRRKFSYKGRLSFWQHRRWMSLACKKMLGSVLAIAWVTEDMVEMMRVGPTVKLPVCVC